MKASCHPSSAFHWQHTAESDVLGPLGSNLVSCLVFQMQSMWFMGAVKHETLGFSSSLHKLQWRKWEWWGGDPYSPIHLLKMGSNYSNFPRCNNCGADFRHMVGPWVARFRLILLSLPVPCTPDIWSLCQRKNGQTAWESLFPEGERKALRSYNPNTPTLTMRTIKHYQSDFILWRSCIIIVTALIGGQVTLGPPAHKLLPP